MAAYTKVEERSTELSAVIINYFAYLIKASVLDLYPVTKSLEAASRNLNRRNISVDPD